MTDYLTVADILAIHSDQIERYGGSHGIRDPGLLEAALFRPQTGYYEDIIAQTAALWESLGQNHPFIDGNKRTAFACSYTFLTINGFVISADAESCYDFITGLYNQNQFNFDALEKWLRANCSRL